MLEEPLDPKKISEEAQQEENIRKGYNSYDFKWCGSSIPERICFKCLMCESEGSLDAKNLIKNKTLPTFCPACKRRALKICDAGLWSEYLELELWNYEFFNDQYELPFSVYSPNGINRTLAVRSKDFKCSLLSKIKNKTKLDEAVLFATGLALRSEKKHRLEPRVVKYRDEIWVDLCDDAWQAVKINGDGWNTENHPPVLFRRYRHQKPMHVEEGTRKDLEDFMKLMNFQSDNEKLLYAGYLASLFVPDIEHVILMPVGSQGSAKTTLTAATRLLVDPSELSTLNMPAEEKDLPQIIMHHYIAAFDNCNYIKQEVSDLLCRACTGAGFSKRELWSDDDDVIYSMQRSIILNGIAPPTQASDLIDRTMMLTLERIPECLRREKNEIEDERDMLMSSVRGYLFSVLAKSQWKDRQVFYEKPRMAEFARIADACAVAMGKTKGEYMEAYIKLWRESSKNAVQADPLASVLLDFLEGQDGWEGTGTELFRLLCTQDGAPLKAHGFPKTANWMAEAMFGRLKPGLIQMGWKIERYHDGSKRIIKITRLKSD